VKVFSTSALTAAAKQAYKISNANVASRPQDTCCQLTCHLVSRRGSGDPTWPSLLPRSGSICRVTHGATKSFWGFSRLLVLDSWVLLVLADVRQLIVFVARFEVQLSSSLPQHLHRNKYRYCYGYYYY